MPDLELLITRETVEEGRSFSPEAMHNAGIEMIQWLGAQILTHWDETGVPPTRVRITAQVEIQ